MFAAKLSNNGFLTIRGVWQSRKQIKETVVRVPLVVLNGNRSATNCQEEKTIDEVCIWQQEPPNFRVHATMHLIMILIRWLVGFIGGGLSVVRNDLSCAPSDAESNWFRCVSNGAYCSGVGEMKIDLLLMKLNGLLDRRLAHAIISPHCRAHLQINPYQPDYFVVDTALLSTNFSPPVPRAWG
jgi:hypothetical protein